MLLGWAAVYAGAATGVVGLVGVYILTGISDYIFLGVTVGALY